MPIAGANAGVSLSTLRSRLTRAQTALKQAEARVKDAQDEAVRRKLDVTELELEIQQSQQRSKA